MIIFEYKICWNIAEFWSPRSPDRSSGFGSNKRRWNAGIGRALSAQMAEKLAHSVSSDSMPARLVFCWRFAGFDEMAIGARNIEKKVWKVKEKFQVLVEETANKLKFTPGVKISNLAMSPICQKRRE